jgi:hypothetical protein
MTEEMRVVRVETETGSHIEPPLDQDWDDLTKLRWHAAVVTYDTGIPIEVYDGRYSVKRFGKWRPVPGVYGFSVPGCSGGAMSYQSMWSWLNGFSSGVDSLRRVTGVSENTGFRPSTGDEQ